MDMTAQGRKAEELRKFNGGPRMLGLPKAWDVAGARGLGELGYPVVGADCVSARGVSEGGLIEKLVKAVAGPLNILVTPGCPPIPELEKLGVRRASIGSGVMRSTLGLVRRIGRELLEKGTYSSVFEEAIPFAEVNALLARSASATKRNAHP